MTTIKRFTFALLFLGILGAFAPNADARRYYPRYRWHGSGYGGGGYGTTAEESIARGMSSVIRARGAAALNNAKAASEYEKVRRARMENRLRASEINQEMKQQRKERRQVTTDEEKAKRLARYEKERLKQRRPNSSQLDPLTGRINWTSMLKGEEFSDLRDTIDNLFKQRANQGTLTLTEKTLCSKTIKTWQDRINKNALSYDKESRLEARRILRYMDYEAKHSA